MLIEAPQRSGDQVFARVRSSIGDFTLWYHSADFPPESAADAFLTAWLVPAMRKEKSLQIEAPVSPRLLANIERAQDLLLTWYRGGWEGVTGKQRLQHVEVRAEVRRSVPFKGEGAAAFFTAGVDSFFTALKHIDEIKALIYVHGFDVMLGDVAALETATGVVESAAAALGKPLIQVVTNFHDLSPKFISWGPVHGAALGSVAALFGGKYERVYVPASIREHQSHLPWGSHPSLDPLWSTDAVDLVYDGSEFGRYDKIEAIADNPLAQKYLRVCLESPIDELNCGCCEKCLRTMVLLRAVGKLESFPIFPPLDLQNMVFKYPTRMADTLWRGIWQLHLSRLEESGNDPELQEAMRRVLAR